MKAARWIAVAAVLAAVAMTGCQERQSRQAKVRWVPTETGWYQPETVNTSPQTGK
jgi:hypothetical protein